MNGKGSNRRPTDEEQYMSNWEAIFGKRNKELDQEELNKEKTDELSGQTKDVNR